MKPVYVQETDWKGTIFVEEFYETGDFSKIAPITQVQAVTFLDKNTIVLFEHIDGYYSLPGGKVDPGESLENALKRETIEEMQAEIINMEPIGYFKNWKKEKPKKVSYNVRYWATIKLLDAPINDPAGKAIGRMPVPIGEVVKKLGWGEKGHVVIDAALKRMHT